MVRTTTNIPSCLGRESSGMVGTRLWRPGAHWSGSNGRGAGGFTRSPQAGTRLVRRLDLIGSGPPTCRSFHADASW